MALPTVTSDHSPILLYLEPRTKSGRTFNFETFWADHVECEEVVQQGWQVADNQEDLWGNVFARTSKCKLALASWQKQTFGKAIDEIRELKEKLQGLLNQQPQVEWGEIKMLQGKIDDLWLQ